MLFKFYKNIINELYFINNKEKGKNILNLATIFNKNDIFSDFILKKNNLYKGNILIDDILTLKFKKSLWLTFCRNVNIKYISLKTYLYAVL